MGGDARRLVEQRPAAEIGLDIGGEFDEEALDAGLGDKPHHVVDADEGNEAERAGRGHGSTYALKIGAQWLIVIGCQSVALGPYTPLSGAKKQKIAGSGSPIGFQNAQ